MKLKARTWLSYLVIILPPGYGWLNYGALPATMATHFGGANSQPDGYMAKPLMVFGLPILMVLLQAICLGVTQLNAAKKGPAPRFERMITWIIPLITVVAYTTTIAYNLGHALDIWRIAISLVGVIFIAMGNYLPTVSATQYRRMHMGWQPAAAAWSRLKYSYGYLMVGGGLLLLLSLLTVSVVSWIVLGLIIISLLVITIYAIRTAKPER